jgi:hypothetical protein
MCPLISPKAVSQRVPLLRYLSSTEKESNVRFWPRVYLQERAPSKVSSHPDSALDRAGGGPQRLMVSKLVAALRDHSSNTFFRR